MPWPRARCRTLPSSHSNAEIRIRSSGNTLHYPDPPDKPELRAQSGLDLRASDRIDAAHEAAGLLRLQHVLTTPFDVSIRDEIAWVEFRRGKEELWLADLDGS